VDGDGDGAVVGADAVRLPPVPDAASMLAPVRSASIDVAVLDGHRGGGIGERLMRAAEAVARERGAARVVLDVAAGNDRALRFYRERLGYRPFGVLLVSDPDRGEDAPPATVDGEPER
jgi:ribosomal protein S18 acetylase RimI-like enzyme